MFETIIFDLDGTLLDTLDDLADGVNAALAAYHYPVRTREEVRGFVGNGVLNLMKKAVPGGESAPDFAEVFAYFKEYYAAHSQIKTRPYEGIVEMIRAFHGQGKKMAIVSNKFHQAVVELNELYFGDLIPVAIGENEAAGIQKKPAPDTVYAAMKALGADMATTVYVGDSEVDHATAQNAGLPCILVSWGFRDRELLASFAPYALVDEPCRILEICNQDKH